EIAPEPSRPLRQTSRALFLPLRDRTAAWPVPCRSQFALVSRWSSSEPCGQRWDRFGREARWCRTQAQRQQVRNGSWYVLPRCAPTSKELSAARRGLGGHFLDHRQTIVIPDGAKSETKHNDHDCVRRVHS